MLRSALLATIVALAGGGAAAQDPASDINFILRPTEVEAGDVLDIFPGDPEPPPDEPPPRSPPLAGPTGEEAIGPPLAGPDGTEPIGPLLAGPAFPPPPPPELPVSRPREPELEPFAAIGMKYGTFVIRPAIEIGVHATDNPAGGSEKRPSVGLVVAPEINAIWNGSRHEVEADLRGEAILYGEKELDERESEARIRARYDLSARTTLRAEAGYRQSLDRFSDPDTPDAAIERPAVEDLDAEIGATHEFGTLALGLAGGVDRSIHEDVPLADGGIASRKELDNTEFAARFRAAYVRGGRSQSLFRDRDRAARL